VLRLALDLASPFGVNVARRRADALPVGRRHDSGVVECLCRQQLDPKPQGELAPLAEDLSHFRQGVAVDHGPNGTFHGPSRLDLSRRKRMNGLSRAIPASW
jgi:hypothetical protein